MQIETHDAITLTVQSFGNRHVFAVCQGVHYTPRLRDALGLSPCVINHAYVTGRETPNYPVPAIPLQCHIGPRCVSWWQRWRDTELNDLVRTVP